MNKCVLELCMKENLKVDNNLTITFVNSIIEFIHSFSQFKRFIWCVCVLLDKILIKWPHLMFNTTMPHTHDKCEKVSVECLNKNHLQNRFIYRFTFSVWTLKSTVDGILKSFWHSTPPNLPHQKRVFRFRALLEQQTMKMEMKMYGNHSTTIEFFMQEEEKEEK